MNIVNGETFEDRVCRELGIGRQAMTVSELKEKVVHKVLELWV